MQEKESIMVVWCNLKMSSLGITVRHDSASFLVPNSYLCYRIFNLHLTISKDTVSIFYTYLIIPLKGSLNGILPTLRIPHLQNRGFTLVTWKYRIIS